MNNCLNNHVPENRKVTYVHNDTLMRLSSKIPNVQNRASVVHNLIKSYDLLKHMNVVNVAPATTEDLCKFHSSLYIDFLRNISENYTKTVEEDKDEVVEEFSNESEDYGIGYDCPIVEHVFELSSLIAGSSITAAKILCERKSDVVINWYGGWHHAQRDQAEGFCYVNDIVLAIEELRVSFGRVLYIDLDIHHGNGVENAYNFTSKVLTLSFHKHEAGFYPGTGDLKDVGIGKGKFYTVNVPLKEGMNNISYRYLFECIIKEIMTKYKPNAVVLQCGADGLTGDKLGGFNLTQELYGYCLRRVLGCKIPTLVLGGGGYNVPNVARCWTYLTAICVNQNISNNIPDNENFSIFGPDFTLNITESNRKDYNSREYLNSVLHEIIYNIRDNIQ
ncbi:histone deacetylase 8-like [Planococcus citri]|uniref:histone deacetylase 8-like n=1 Tax=Planococcus citri TaxID=170843 RepID=UPI0031FA451D